jgi:hypothetical protein
MTNSRQGQQLQAMKKAVKDKATNAGIDPALIINNAGLKALAFQGDALENLPTWQALIEAGF